MVLLCKGLITDAASEGSNLRLLYDRHEIILHFTSLAVDDNNFSFPCHQSNIREGKSNLHAMIMVQFFNSSAFHRKNFVSTIHGLSIKRFHHQEKSFKRMIAFGETNWPLRSPFRFPSSPSRFRPKFPPNEPVRPHPSPLLHIATALQAPTAQPTVSPSTEPCWRPPSHAGRARV